jgi:hypothetical protein
MYLVELFARLHVIQDIIIIVALVKHVTLIALHVQTRQLIVQRVRRIMYSFLLIIHVIHLVEICIIIILIYVQVVIWGVKSAQIQVLIVRVVCQIIFQI